MQQELVALGIDLGSRISVISLANGLKTETLLNESSQRENETIVGINGVQRFFGEQGALQYKTNPNNTIRGFNRLLGVQTLDADELHHNIVQDANNKYVFKCHYNGGEVQYTPEQLTASFIKYLTQLTDIQGQVVISYPNYYTDNEISALKTAANIAQINLKALVPQSVAVANYYQIYRQPLNQAVLFIDFGYSTFQAYVVGNNRILCEVYSRTLGIRNADIKLFNWIIEMIGDKMPQDNVLRNKLHQRIKETCEKTRKTLSANKSAVIELENINKDEDFIHTIERTDYESIIDSVIQELSYFLYNLLQQINKQNIQISAIEFLGGGSRIPLFQDSVKNIFRDIPIKKSLNATECISEGCALTAVMMDLGQPICKPTLHYPLYVGWYGDTRLTQLYRKLQPNDEIRDKFTKNMIAKVDDHQQIIRCVAEDYIEITIFYEPAPIGFSNIIKQCTIQGVNNNEAIITVARDHHGTINVIEAYIVKDKLKQQLQIDEEYVSIAKFIEFENLMQQNDTNVQQAKYELEKCIIQLKKQLASNQYTVNQILILGQEVESLEEWFNSAEYTIQEYQVAQQNIIAVFSDIGQ